MAEAMPRYAVTEEEAGRRVDKFLSGRLPEYSRGDLQKLISGGGVAVNGAPAKKSHTLQAGDAVTLDMARLTALTDLHVEPAAIPLDILHEDDDIVVVNKPPGLVVHPVAGGRGESLVAGLLHHCEHLADTGDPLRAGIVHRLDRDTSGVIVAAKTERARAHLIDQFRMRQVRKRYLAVVRGAPEQSEGEITLPIGRDGRVHDRMVVRALAGRRAITHYVVAERFEGYALVEVFPRTGRTHQIRVHLSALGHPVVADGSYGGGGAVYESELAGGKRGRRERPLIERQALHAESITLSHPSSHREFTFSAPLPDDMRRLIDALRRRRSRRA